MKVLFTLFAVMMLAAPAMADWFEDFDDGTCPDLTSSGSSVDSHIREDGPLVTQTGSPGAGDWPTWEPGEDGALRTGALGISAYTTFKMGYGTYSFDIRYEIWDPVGPVCEKKAPIVLFGDINTGNMNSHSRGVIVSAGMSAPWGLEVQGAKPGTPEDVIWSLSWPEYQGTYRPFQDGSLTWEDRHTLNIIITIYSDKTLDMWWKSFSQASYTQPIAGLDVSAYIDDEGYLGLNSADAGYHLWDNVSYTGGGVKYTLTTSSSPGGSVTTPGEGQFQYDSGSQASIIATADFGYDFVNWTGTGVDAGKVADPNSAGTTITMDDNYTLQANFAQGILYTLTTSSSSGGLVTAPGEGQFQYTDGTVVSITATPNMGYIFVNWTGTGVIFGNVADPNSASTTITMDDNYTLQANFTQGVHYTLTTSSSSGGLVTAPGEGQFQYFEGSNVPVLASPDMGYHFVNWTGTGVTAGKVGNPNAAGTPITMDADYTLQANFAAGSGDLLIEAESFEGVSTSAIFDAAGPWALATAAGMDEFGDTASGGEAIYAGAFTQWPNCTDAYIAKVVELPSPKTYSIYVRSYRDDKERDYHVKVLTPFRQALSSAVGQSTDGDSGFYWESVGSFGLEDAGTQEIVIEISKYNGTEHVPVCDAVLIVDQGAGGPSGSVAKSALWSSGFDPLGDPSGGEDIAEPYGSAEMWSAGLPQGWTLHAGGGSPTLEQETSAPYVTDGDYAIKVNVTQNSTGVMLKVYPDTMAAYRVLVDTYLEAGTAKYQVNTTTQVLIDHVPMPSGATTYDLTVMTSPDDTDLLVYFISTSSSATFYVDNVRVYKIMDLDSDYETHIPDRIDVLQLKYPHYPGNNPAIEYPDVTLTDAGDTIVVEGEFCRMTFDDETGGISSVWLRGEDLNPVCLPEAYLVDANGIEYFQRYAQASGLDWNTSADGKYFEIRSSVVPRTSGGVRSPLGFNYLYRIHKRVGIVLVYAEAFDISGANIRMLAFLNGLGDSAGMEVDHLMYYSHGEAPSYPTPGQPTFSKITSHADGLIYSDHLISATWTNGAIGIQVMANRMQGSQIYWDYIDASSYEPTALKYFAIRTRDGQRAVDYFAVSQPAGREVSIDSGTTFTHAFNLLPIHRHRPKIEFISSGIIGSHPLIWNMTNPPEPEIRQLAKIGVDYVYISYPPDGAEALVVDQYRLKHITRLLHKYGLKSWMGSATTPNNATSWINWGWMTAAEIDSAMYIDILREPGLGEGPNDWPNGSGVWMCMNSEKFRKDVLLDKMILDPIDMSNCDASYMDIHTPLPCGNPGHGCAPVTVPVEGNIKFLEDFHDAMEARGTEGKRFAGHCGWAFNTAYSLMDFTLPGEFNFGMPGETELNTVWTSMLFGIQCQFYTGEMDVSTPGFYDKVLSRGSIAYIHLMPTGATGSFTRAEQKLWIKYMTPLKIYDIENSVLHHPFDHDYDSYASVDTADVFPIVYRRPGDIFLVITKENPALSGVNVEITLEADALGLSDNVLIFNAVEGIDGELATGTVVAGQLVLNVQLGDGPSMFRILSEPSEPTVLWHDPGVWNTTATQPDGGAFDIDVSGVPQSEGKVLLWYGDSGLPEEINGATLVDIDMGAQVATLSIYFSEDGETRFGPLSSTYPVSLFYDMATGYLHLTWPKAPGKLYEIYWTDELSTPTIWDRVDGPALSDIIDNGDGTFTWIDMGTDPDMGGKKPEDVGKRFYTVSGFFWVWSENFDDGLAPGMGDNDFGWPPGMVPIDGSDPLANPVRDNIYGPTQNGIVPGPGNGDWETWSSGMDGAVRTGPADEAWVLDKLGFGTYTMDITAEMTTGNDWGMENRTPIILFGSHPTQNISNSLQSGVMVLPGRAGDWGLAVLGVLPTDPDDLLWSYDPGKGFAAPIVDYRPFYNGSLTVEERHTLSVKLELLAPGLLSMWWKAGVETTWSPVFADVDVSAYLIEWSGDPASGFVLVGPATEGYWGMGSADSRYNLWDNLQYTSGSGAATYTPTTFSSSE